MSTEIKSGESYRTVWPAVLGLVGLDYFTTLAYQPSIAVSVAGRLAPLATTAIVLLTVVGLLPIYLFVAGRSSPGEGSVSIVERLIKGWRGKLLVLALLGFAATNFLFTRTLSTADAAVHALNNPIPAWQSAIDNLAGAGERLQPAFDNSAWRWLCGLWNRQLAATLLLLALGIVFWIAVGGRFSRRMVHLASGLVGVYLVLTAVILASGLIYLLRHGEFIDHWWADVREGAWGISKPTWAGTDALSLAKMGLWLLPKMALALSGFEVSMVVMPLLAGDRAAQVAGTRKILIISALVMSAFLLSSAFVTTLLMPPDALQAGGAAHERALAALAHGQGLNADVDANAINPIFGRTFGTVYDLVTMTVLCLAGASVMLALRNLLPQFLSRFGMQLQWAHAIGAVYHLFGLISLAVTLLFRASVEAQRSAYAISVLAVMTSAAWASAIDAWKNCSTWSKPLAVPFAVVAIVLSAMALGLIVYHPGCLLIAGLFIVAIVGTSMASRWLRSGEFRFDGFVFDGESSVRLWDRVRHLEYSVLVPIHPGGRVSVVDKEIHVRKRDRVDDRVPLIFLEVEVSDASEFQQQPVVSIWEENGRYRIRVTRCASIAHVIFAIGREFSKVGEPPEIHFGWCDQHPLLAALQFLLFGEGNIPYLVNDLLRRHEPDHTKRPRVIIG